MMPPSAGTTPIQSIRGQAPGLKGIEGRISLQVADAPAGVLLVESSGEVGIVPDGESAAVLAVDSDNTLAKLLSGELNPIIAFLQGRMRLQGEPALVLRVLLGLEEGSPWRGAVQRG